jgi:hypothetical protein
MTADNLVFNNLTLTDLTLTGKINNNTTAQNLNSLDTTTSISSQFIDAKNYTDNKINLLLNNPDVSINSIQELFNILGNDPNLNVVNSLASKVSKTESNQTIDALNLNFTNPILSSDYLLRNTDNSTKSIKNSIETNETNITSLTNNKANKNADTLTNCSFNSCRITGEGLYIPNQTSNNITLTRGNNLITCNQNEVRELDFCNVNNVNWGTNERAFSFKKMNNLNVLEELLRINVNGTANLLGDLSSGGISISSLNTSINNINTSLNTINNAITISNNNIGIGTTGPTGKLHVVGNSILNGNTTITGSLNSGSVSSGSNITSSGNMVCLGLIYGNVVQANSGNLLSLNRDITNGITHINGRLGIGISTPVFGSLLHVNGDTTITGSLGATNAIKCDVLQTNNPNKILSINAGLDDTAITYIKGKLGVGTNNIVEGSDLHVVGNSTIDGSSNTTGNINANSFTIGGLVNIGDALTNSMDLINSLQTQVNSLQSQINSLIKIKTRLRVSFSASSYVIITQSNVSSVARISSGVCGIILTQNSNVIGAWTPFVSVNNGTRSNVSSGASANYPDYDYVVSMSGDFGFSFMLIEQ